MIVNCNVWCSDSDIAEGLGLESGDIWMPLCFRMENVVAIKEAGPNDFLGEGKATIHFSSGEHLTIDLQYTEMAEMLKLFDIKEKYAS